MFSDFIKLSVVRYHHQYTASLGFSTIFWNSCGCDRMVVGFTTNCTISAHQHLSCEFEFLSWPDVLDTTLCDKVCQWLATGLWFSSGTPVASTNKTKWYDKLKYC